MEIIPQTYGEAHNQYPWIEKICHPHEWDNRTTVENLMWMMDKLEYWRATYNNLYELLQIKEKEVTSNNIHELKTYSEHYQAVKEGIKKFEVRKNDRDFKVGDRLFLACYDPNDRKYVNRGLIKCDVTYILHGPQFGIKKGYCVMGIKVITSPA